MAGRKASPKPAEPKPAKRRQHQSKPEYESVTPVSFRKTEKDVVKLIDCLAELTRDVRAARSAAMPLPPGRSGSRPRAPRVVATRSPVPSYPRGNPLTQSMEFTDRDGAVWLAYIEGAGPPPRPEQAIGSVLPERHLRFDSATESRFTTLVPAGSPFLAEARLQSLLDGAQPEPQPASSTGAPARDLPSPGHGVEELTRAVGPAREAIADWFQRWEQSASRRQALRRRVVERLSGAASTMHGLVEVLLGHRSARPQAGR
jgi:hypothetical protein